MTPDKQRELSLRMVSRWKEDPVQFCADVFTVRMPDGSRVPARLWHKQIEIMKAVAAHRRVTVRSGHKCGKSTTAAFLAWWWFMTRPRARVLLTAPSYTQVSEILWAEFKRIGQTCRFALGGKMGVNPDAGFEAKDGRQVIGFSTDKPERAAGFSSPSMLIIVDEASGFDEKIFEALLGNLAGGAHILLLSNPTQPSGFYYDSFHAENSAWHQIHMSSRECALSWPSEMGDAGRGLATIEWCDDLLRDYGPKDSRYQVRVEGNFPAQAANALISLEHVEAAKAGWSSEPSNEDNVRGLRIGVDVARFGTDKTVIIWSRGNWASVPIVLSGSDNVEVAGRVLELVREIQREGEEVEVNIDTTNNGGVADIVRHADVEGVRVSDMQYASDATADGFSRLRDQIWDGLRVWLKEGGKIPPERMLTADILAPRKGFDARGRMKVESKDDLKKRIGRSPDYGDALALAVFTDRTLIQFGDY